MKRSIITASAIILLSLCIYSCNDESSSSTPATEQTTSEVKTGDTASSKRAIDSVVTVPEEPKTNIEEKKAKSDTASAARKPKTPAIKTDEPKAGAIDQAAIDEGKALIAKSDCLACHKLQDKLVGPSYADVATKYSYSNGTVQNLASKVINGGTGVWGQIPMAPHPNVTPEAAKKMVTYILSLKK
jgi:cytochrome c